MRHDTTAIRTAPALDAWARLPWTDGVQIEALERLDGLRVLTRNTTYELTVLCPRTGEVMVRGGQYFPDYTRAHIAGSSLGGSFLKVHGVYVGFSLELVRDGERIVTTRVRSVSRVTHGRVQ